ncbi:MAG TPA: hypothetical protein VKP69_11925 [Isosphaeraceae bacterium]|nr:hypothetical protein [Isosphaeraceae bacterium]
MAGRGRSRLAKRGVSGKLGLGGAGRGGAAGHGKAGRVKEMRRIIAGLCGGEQRSIRYYPILSRGGVFDHGDFWGRKGAPAMMVGAPYAIDDSEKAWLGALAQFQSLQVAMDDRPSLYGSGTHHVRIALV